MMRPSLRLANLQRKKNQLVSLGFSRYFPSLRNAIDFTILYSVFFSCVPEEFAEQGETLDC